MKTCMFYIMACLGIGVLSARADSNDWYHIWKGQTYVAEYTLKPGDSTNVTIKADKALTVSFQSDGTQEQVKTYKKPPLTLEQVNAPKASTYVKAYSSVQGVGGEFTPANGKIILKISNSGKDVFRVVILSGKMQF